MLEILFATEVLPVRVFHPPHDNLFIRQAIRVLEILQTHHQPCRFRRAAVVGAIQFAKSRIENIPIDQLSEPIKLMVLIEQVGQAVAKQVGRRGWF